MSIPTLRFSKLSACVLISLLSLVIVFTLYCANGLLVYYSKQCVRWSDRDSPCGNDLKNIDNTDFFDKLARSDEVGSLLVRSVFDNDGNMTVQERQTFQRKQVNEFCQKYNLTSQSLSLPVNHGNHVYHHLLLNDVAQTLFCYVPKVGCTNLKVLYFIAQGLIPRSVATATHKTVRDSVVKDAVAMTSLTGLGDEECEKIVKTYYKFVMYRHPLERLVSAYRSKVRRLPLSGVKDESPHYNWLRKHVFKHNHPKEYREWYESNGTVKIVISFFDFVSYWLNNSDYRTQHDEHLMPIFDLCEPCRVRYDYYGNFHTFEKDANVLVNKIGTDMAYLRQSYYANREKETAVLMKEFYGELSLEQKEKVLKRLSQDIDFYYHLFPLEIGSHKHILNITNELAEP